MQEPERICITRTASGARYDHSGTGREPGSMAPCGNRAMVKAFRSRGRCWPGPGREGVGHGADDVAPHAAAGLPEDG
jgi:hypothetical protein